MSRRHEETEIPPENFRPAGTGHPGQSEGIGVVMRVNLVLLSAVFFALFARPAGASEAAQPPPELAAAEHAYAQNLALGDALGGRPAETEQAAEAERLFREALAEARACIAANARSAEAHHLAGLVLCTAYRPVAVPFEDASDRELAEDERDMVVFLRRGAATGCEEGLTEMRTALRLKPADPEYHLDYAEALSTCNALARCEEQALALWDGRPTMANLQCARCACLLADCARRRSEPDVEIRWLREAARYNPQDTQVAQRLAALAAAQPRILWLSYDAGKALAESAQKPMLIDFTAELCGWCRRLERDVFSRADVVACSKRFVCIKVDETDRRDLVAAFNVQAYPTAVVLDHTGRELHRITGYRPAAQYVAGLQTVLPPE